MLISFSVEKQIITRTDTEKIVTNSMNYLYAQFTFSEEWTGEKTAVFTAQKKTYNALLDENNTCLVPWEVLTGSILTVSVFCGDLITANKVIIYTIPSGYEVGDESRIPTPEIYIQIIEKLNEIEAEVDPEAIMRTVDEYLDGKNIVTEEDVDQIVEDYIEAHKSEWQGEVGPQGPEGPQGPAGPAGPQGPKGDYGGDFQAFINVDFETDEALTIENLRASGKSTAVTLTDNPDGSKHLAIVDRGYGYNGIRFVIKDYDYTRDCLIKLELKSEIETSDNIPFYMELTKSDSTTLNINNVINGSENNYNLKNGDIICHIRKNTLEFNGYTPTDDLTFSLSTDYYPLAFDFVLTATAIPIDAERNQTLQSVAEKVYTPLNGKRTLFLGDSIVADMTRYSWVIRFAEITGCEIIGNHAKSSTFLHDSQYVDPSCWLTNQVRGVIDADYENVDLIIIAVGTNSGITADDTRIMNAYYDTENDTDIPLADVDTTTSEGAFRFCNESLHIKYPNAIICWCSPIHTAKSIQRASFFKKVVEWDEALNKLTVYGAVNCIHTLRCGIMNTTNSYDGSGMDLRDGVHVNERGAWEIARYNAAAISQLFA